MDSLTTVRMWHQCGPNYHLINELYFFTYSSTDPNQSDRDKCVNLSSEVIRPETPRAVPWCAVVCTGVPSFRPLDITILLIEP